MSKRISLWILLCFIFPLSMYSQGGTLSGNIVDATTKEPLIGATISVGDTGETTDFNGKFSIDLPEGAYDVKIDYVGYKTFTESITIDAYKNTQLIVQLEERATLLQTATVTSGRFEKPLGEVTVSLDILKPELIESNNSTSVDEILDKIPGVNIIDGQANIRGGSGYSYGAGSRVMLLIDDIPALQADAGFPNWDDIPVENVEQIEVVKGAASALYGSAALNGIVNVRTAYAKSTPETKASIFYTYFGAPKDTNKQWWKDTDQQPFATGLSASHKQKFNKLDLVASTYYLYRDSWNKATYSRYGRATLGLRYRASDRFSFGLNGNVNTGNNQDWFFWQNHEEGAMIANPNTFSRSVRTRFIVDPFLTYFDQSGNRHKVLSRIYSVDNKVSGNRSNKSQLYYGEYQFQRNFENTNFVITTGVVGSYTNINAELYGDGQFNGNNLAAYTQLDKKIGNRLNLSGGVRYEYNKIEAPDSILVGATPTAAGTSSEGKPIFRIGANYQAGEFTYFRASWGQGYRFPTIAEKFISTNVGFQIFPNVDLSSETGFSTELGLKQGFRISDWEGFFDVAAFWSQYNDMMEFTFSLQQFAFQSQNVGNTDIRGFDLSLMGRGDLFGNSTNLIAGYTYIDPTFQDFTDEDLQNSSADYNILKYRYKHSWKFDIESNFGKFKFGLAGFYNSNMEAIDNLFNEIIVGLKEYREVNNTGFTVFDVRASYQLNKQFQLSLLAKNVFNEEYRVRPALLEAPRNFTIKLEGKF